MVSNKNFITIISIMDIIGIIKSIITINGVFKVILVIFVDIATNFNQSKYWSFHCYSKQ